MFTDIRKLRTFVTIVEEGSLTAAAERLNMAQPWISVQLKQLEESLDLVLLERTKGKAVQLSPAGTKFLPVAKRLLSACELASREITSIKDENRGRLVLGIDPITLYFPEANKLIEDFKAKWPKTEVELVSRQPHELFDGLKSGQFDLILASCPAPDTNIEIREVCDYPLYFFVPKAGGAEYADVSVKGLDGARMLTLPLGYHPSLYAWLNEELAPLHLRYVRCPEDSFHVLLRYAAKMGVATLSPDLRAIMPDIADALVPHDIAGMPPLTISWGLMRMAGQSRKPADLLWRLAAPPGDPLATPPRVGFI
jgi:DNA-binding transcriptional LysR family regulator